MKQIFDYRDYRDFVNEFISEQPIRGHGVRSRMAKAMGCQLAYFSQVLHRKAHLSLDQGLKLNTGQARGMHRVFIILPLNEQIELFLR